MSADNNKTDFSEVLNRLNSRYKNVDIHSIVDNGDGSVSLVIGSNDSEAINKALSALGKGTVDSLPVVSSEALSGVSQERASVVYRDPLSRGYLDLATRPGALKATPQEIYKRSVEMYRTRDVYGTFIDTLTNFSSKGMVNDLDDDNIRNFYDHWVIDAGVDVIVEQIFFEFFRSGFVRTYRVLGKYEPKVSYISPKPGVGPSPREKGVLHKLSAAKKIKWSKSYIPIKYTILNPTQIEVEKSSLLSDKQLIVLKSSALSDMKELLETPSSELTEFQKKIIKNIPPDFKKAARNGEDLLLDPNLIGEVDYRRQPYEQYPYPKGLRAFESMDYKKSLRQADYSTLDGITNFLLVVTIGNDQYPIRGQEQLDNVAELFNTPSKSFNVFWDHTLKIERIEPSDVGDILGRSKYEQVNEDITGAFGMIRALIDGRSDSSKEAVKLATQALREEIHYARKQVSRWIYKEYRDIAEAMGFDRYPRVRFNNMILKDEILMMNVIQGMIDRRIISYRSGHEMLGLDHDTILHELETERDFVLDGTLGIIGSPYNPKATPFTSKPDNVQDTQRAPKGSPSEGRPRGKPSKTPAPNSKPSRPKAKKPEASASKKDIKAMLSTLSEDEINTLYHLISDIKASKDKEDTDG